MNNQTDNTPLIVGFVADLMFTVRIETALSPLGYQMRWVGQAADIAPAGEATPNPQPGEPLQGQSGALFEQITLWQPALLIFDLGNEAIPWQRWIALLKSSPATRRIPVLCYGAHVDVATLQAARDAGADEVVARSRFASALPELVGRLARRPDTGGIQAACAEPLSELAIKGLEAYNRGAYYDAHEELEFAWKADPGPGRDLYRAILQIAVAYYQIERGNYRGALKMLLRVRQWLEPLSDTCRGVDVAQLRQDTIAVHEALLQLGSDRLTDLDRSLFRPVSYQTP